MFCPYCGNSCDDSHKFCYRCGKPLPMLPASESVPAEEVTAEIAPTILQTEEPAETTSVETAEETESDIKTVETDTEDEPSAALVAADTGESSKSAPQPNKGRLWPPFLALCIMICVGLAAFIFGNGGPKEARSCFSIENGVLYFDYSLYTGSDALTIPDTVNGMVVTAISDGCFRDCDQLTTIILPETVTTIGENAFYGCDSIRGIYIPNGVLSVGAKALAECSSLEAISFPATILEVGEGCLDHCESLQYLFYDGTYTQWRELYDGEYRTGMELHTNDGTYYAQP